ncbi:MAG: TIGR03118 family protein [Luteolibacter sp.]|uniref:TIGR03118 family protein n=1 Tax=Luteolibacter sp. TaxID=1962973 RepID=UPI003267F2A4
MRRSFFPLNALPVFIASVTGVISCKPPASEKPVVETTPVSTSRFDNTILVANRPEFKPTAFVDQQLVNPWGIALRPPGAGGHIWTSNAGNASTSLYIGDVNGKPLSQDGLKILSMAAPLISYEDGLINITGQVYNAASDIPGQPVEFFIKGTASDLTSGKPVSIGESSGSAKFVFVTTEGTIHAWRAKTAESMDTAIIVKDFSDHGKDQDKSLPHLAAFTGVAMTTDSFTKDATGRAVTDNRLYVTDFQNKRILTFDNQWDEITNKTPFARPANLPEDFSPYNVQCIGDKLYVVYAVVDLGADEAAVDVPGKGNGHVAIYDRDGHLLRELADKDLLDSPWGVTIAPAGFGDFGGDILLANFGDGSIAAFNSKTGTFHDYLRDNEAKPLNLDGIWGIVFGNGVGLGDAMSLYYTAGPNNEQDGVFGKVTVAKERGVASK